MNQSFIPVPDLTDEVLTELTEVYPENKNWVMQNLGFTQLTDKRYWKHPDLKDISIFFDLQTDDISTLVNKIADMISVRTIMQRPGVIHATTKEND